MTERDRRRRPSLEAFEPRALLSTGYGASPGLSAELSHGTTDTAALLAGTIHGQYRILEATLSPDTGTIYLFTGAGHVRGLGHATATGDMRGVGFIAQGRAQGEFTLRRGGESIDIQLTALETQPGFQGLPSAFSYVITGGTGTGINVRGQGSATLTMVPGGQGRFTLVLRPSTSPVY